MDRCCSPPLSHQYTAQSRVVRSTPFHSNWIKHKLGIKSTLVFILLISVESGFPGKGLFNYRIENLLFVLTLEIEYLFLARQK